MTPLRGQRDIASESESGSGSESNEMLCGPAASCCKMQMA